MPRTHLPSTMPRRAAAVVAVAAAVVLSTAPFATPAHADSWRDAQWYLDEFDIEAIHDVSTGEGVTIGIIDTGTDVTHPDLQGAHVTPATGYGTIADPFSDPENHGTSMAALMVGQGHGPDGADGVLGLAPDADLVVTSLNWDSETRADAELWQAQAVTELVELGVDVIATSIGGGSGAQEEMLAALESAREAGVPVVVAAGNSETYVLPGCTQDPCPWADAPTEDVTNHVDGLQAPAWYPNAIPVFAYAPDGSRWENSPDVTPSLQLAISAPGHDLVATNAGGGYAIRSGTSGAAPLVAATFALVKSVHPDATWDQLVGLVYGAAHDAGEPGFDEAYGWGRIDPLAALSAPLPDPVTTPAADTPPPAVGAGEGAADDDGATVPGEPPLWLQHAISAAVLAVVVGGVIALVTWLRRRRRRARMSAVSGA
ncbi:peptidase S8 and S53 subtilisin kexin sedolisin [Beutenbergia cavernae DSM 12333]|uniref:Peptidase S8 and S53 subtilisin kexin sedolisin n=1 Tax=Beutenbergia cavernae (strain ATCC BAA-8 / DSM 12333 / CCUG 43141 / JCM 11478 / NBRC 16432 / NCIMB 13614 / HKI 0122) TaxID=471853 RepID=C5BVN8_BEUC1|nr:S8 family serine peptidase [Beutenbergia cavernae]ACQ78478.1 peptidase S8 and S53 subtilisin kexin sedolisin [Beutenbergia cavernae DSM 12333]